MRDNNEENRMREEKRQDEYEKVKERTVQENARVVCDKRGMGVRGF